MKLHTLRLIFIFFALMQFVSAKTPAPDITGEQLREALPKKLQHPYLYFTDADKPAIKEWIANDPTAKKIYDQLKAHADACLEDNPRRVNTQALAFVYQMTGDKRYAQRAFELLGDFNFRPDEFEELGLSFSLNNSRSCRTLAPIYDWLYTGLTEPQREHIRKGLRQQLSLVEGDKYEKTWWTTAYKCNWNPVCNSSVGVVAAVLLSDDESMVDLMAKAYNGIYRSYDELGIDGDWIEGVSYRSFGMFVSLLYADCLRNLTNGEFDLLGHEKFAGEPVTFILHTMIPPVREGNENPTELAWKSVNFEDSGEKRGDNSFNYNKLAEATGSGETIWVRDTIFGKDFGTSIFDIIWAKPDIEPKLPEKASRHFRDYGWSVMRSDFESFDKFIIAAVCGEHWDSTREVSIVRFNGAPSIDSSEKPWGLELKTNPYFFSHGHLHAGTFNLYWQGEAYICDLGRPAYPANYWTPARWDYVFANSFGHNVVHVNGVGQTSGKGVGGEIVEFRSGKIRDYTLMDATNAYPQGAMKMWRRHLVLSKPNISVVLDEIETNIGDDISVRFHSDCAVMLKNKVMLIEGRYGKMALIPVLGERWKFVLGEHWLNHKYPDWSDWRSEEPFEDNTRVYSDIAWKAQKQRNVAAAIILPVADMTEAEKIAKSAKLKQKEDGGWVLSFDKSGKFDVFEFAQGENGLRLE